jgi:helicase SWR1
MTVHSASEAQAHSAPDIVEDEQKTFSATDSSPLSAISQHEFSELFPEMETDGLPESPSRRNGVAESNPDGVGAVEAVSRGEDDAPTENDTSTSEPSAQTPSKKRKRPASPPWQFPTAKVATLKTADGRRISARVNVETPTSSETDERVLGNGGNGAKQRMASPPWKKFGADGPTTLQIDGMRKSGRVNREHVEEKRTSPRGRKKQDKLVGKGVETKDAKERPSTPKHSKRGSVNKAPSQPKSGRPSSSSAKIASLQAQIAALQPTNSPPAGHTHRSRRGRRRNNPDDAADNTPIPVPSPGAQRRSKRSGRASEAFEDAKPSPMIKLRLHTARHAIEPPHPQAKPPTPPRPPQLSLYQVLEKCELRELQQPFIESDKGQPDADYFAARALERAAEEGAMRRKLLKEAEPGGVLSKERLSLFRDDRQRDLQPQYGHHDHLVAHALYLRQLQLREKVHHRTIAKKIAQEALEYWRAMHGPTEEDIIEEQNNVFKMIQRQIVQDMKAKWDMVEAHVREVKRVRWEMQEKLKKQELLRKKLDSAQLMLARQRGELDSDEDDEEDSTGDMISNGESESGSEDDEEALDANMSDSSSLSGKDDDEEEGEMDEEALEAYLAQRQAEPPDKGEDDSDNKSQSETSEEDQTIVERDAGDSTSVKDEIAAARTEKGTSHYGDSEVAHTKVESADELDRDDVNDDGDDMSVKSERRARTRAHGSRSVSPTQDEVEAENNLSSDESTNMDSEDYDSDEDMSSSDEDDNDDGSDDDAASDHDVDKKQSSLMKNSLLALFSAKELLVERDGSLPTPMTSVENGGDTRSSPESVSEEQPNHDSVTADNQFKEELEPVVEGQALVEDAMDVDLIEEAPPAEDADIEEVPRDTTPGEGTPTEGSGKTLVPAVPLPALLRGTLRSYQHAGLNWLASLYRNGTNGILADEMGLGKTIQTISVLAHIAEEYAVWEPHLVIVPTSVILNWATEFQKFLPGFRVLAYYGTQEERQLKRRGWANDPHHENKEKRGYNVVITSYNIAMQDISSLRNVQWHYLILDEAHNIRNYNSQRWKVLIRLRSRARILLTGTPLQNNLDEVWALLTFLRTGDEDEESGHGELEEFLSHWEPIVKQIFQDGADKLSAEAQTLVKHLHVSLRPFLLRRQKNEVEKDLPKKTESVVVCKLSKRQRQLYQDYMGLAEIKATLAKGSGVQAGAVLLSLRRVCNHPDLFDPRPIQTSFAMDKSPLDRYSVRERLVRELLGTHEKRPSMLMVSAHEGRRRANVQKCRKLSAVNIMTREADALKSEIEDDAAADPTTLAGSRVFLKLQQRKRELQRLQSHISATELSLRDAPVYGSDLRELLTVRTIKPYTFASRQQPIVKSIHAWSNLAGRPLKLAHQADLFSVNDMQLETDIYTIDKYAERFQDIIVRFAFVPPAVTAPILNMVIPPKMQEAIRSSADYPADADYAHEARVRLSIAFPDARLLVYDSGKLQRLTSLLRDLQARGSRSLIFTQMVGTLDILERFLNLLGMPYLRLDGSTGVERRQLFCAEFNRPDSKYQCMILSSRAGGVGLNLTGASSVIFYDLDWNPQMDRQCMDRAHRIGQVRDVEVYKMVSEKTVEENILRRANQKSLLDQTVIQEGHFTTEHDNNDENDDNTSGESNDAVNAAIERLLGDNEKSATQALESVEDKEDVQAAQAARKEDQNQTDMDAGEMQDSIPVESLDVDHVKEERRGHVDAYMIGFVEEALRGWQYVPPPARKVDKNGRDPSHRPKKKRDI